MFPEAAHYTITDRIGYIYSEFFGLIYPYFHNHFVSYSLILICSLTIIWWTFKQIKRARTPAGKLVFGIVILVVGSFATWLVLFHFHTFLQADLYYDDQSKSETFLK